MNSDGWPEILTVEDDALRRDAGRVHCPLHDSHAVQDQAFLVRPSRSVPEASVAKCMDTNTIRVCAADDSAACKLPFAPHRPSGPVKLDDEYCLRIF